jgi:hypothetical protein
MQVRLGQSALNALREAQSDFLVQCAVNECHFRMNGGKLEILNPNSQTVSLRQRLSSRYTAVFTHHSLHFQVKPKLLK